MGRKLGRFGWTLLLITSLTADDQTSHSSGADAEDRVSAGPIQEHASEMSEALKDPYGKNI